MEHGVLWAIGFVVIGALVVSGFMLTWERFQKNRRTLTEGTVTSVTRQTKYRYSGSSNIPGSLSTVDSYDEVTLNFEFYVNGQKQTGHTTNYRLADKKEGDRIRVYYVSSDPGEHQIVEPIPKSSRFSLLR